MPRRKKSTKSFKKTTKPRKMTKALKKAVKEVVDDQIAVKAETKYLNTDLNAAMTIDVDDPRVDNTNNRALMDITPEILSGDLYLNRIGDKVSALYYQIRMRVHPVFRSEVVAHGSELATSLFPAINYLNAYLIKQDATSAMTAGDYDYCIRRPMENWMDTRQTSERAHRKEFQILGSFKIPLKYDNVCLLDSSTIPCEYNITSFPKLSYVDHKLKIDKKMIFNASSADKPVKYEYKLFLTWGNYFRNSYVDVDFPHIDYWESWTFKDV